MCFYRPWWKRSLLLYFVRYIHGYMKSNIDSHIENVTPLIWHLTRHEKRRGTRNTTTINLQRELVKFLII